MPLTYELISFRCQLLTSVQMTLYCAETLVLSQSQDMTPCSVAIAVLSMDVKVNTTHYMILDLSRPRAERSTAMILLCN